MGGCRPFHVERRRDLFSGSYSHRSLVSPPPLIARKLLTGCDDGTRPNKPNLTPSHLPFPSTVVNLQRNLIVSVRLGLIDTFPSPSKLFRQHPPPVFIAFIAFIIATNIMTQLLWQPCVSPPLSLCHTHTHGRTEKENNAEGVSAAALDA